MNLKATFFLKTFCFAALFCFLCGSTFAQTTITKSFTSSDSWEVPTGVTSLTIECIGGGGAGGYVHGNSLAFRNSGGGGGGAYARKVVTVTPGASVEVTVGNGGQAWATGGNQHDGGDSYVNINSVLTVKAAGGKTVKGTNTTTGAAGGAIGDCIGDQIYAGGKGANEYTTLAILKYPGGGGGAAGSTGPGNAGNNGNGGAARPDYGGKGGDSRIVIGTGRSGENYGGGGSGSQCTGIGGEYGGSGAKGFVIITYQAPPVLAVDDMADTVCSGAIFDITPTGTIPAGTRYSWSAPVVTGIIVDKTSGDSDAPSVSDQLTNTTYNDVNVVYKVIASYSTFLDTFNVSINVKGIINPGTIGDRIVSCNAGDTLKSIISATDASGNGQYSWERSNDGLTWVGVENATDKEYTPSYAGFMGTTYYRRLFSSECTTLYSNIDTVNYPGNVSPGEVTSTQPKKYCKDSTIVATLKANATVASGASYTTQWQSSTDGGTTWTNITGENNNTFNVHITGFTTPISYRYTIKLPGCDSVPSNNQWDYTLHTSPVINKLIPSDTCPGPATYIITPDITPSSGTYTYFWNGDATGAPQSTYTVTALSNKCNQTYIYSLKVKDEHGCPSNRVIDSIAIPAETFTPIAEVTAKLKLTASDCKYIVPNLKDTLESCFHSTCPHIVDSTYTQNDTAGTVIAPNTYVMVEAIFNTECLNRDTVSIKVIAPATVPTLTPADIDFDDSNDTIKIPYYGICDTLYYVHTPSYSATSSSPFDVSELTLTNDKSSTENEGTLLGRISGGEYTIVWRLESPCGGYLEYTKKYIVVYPPCGGSMTVTDADGIVYQTVRVGCECWTKPNLKTITGVTGNSYVYQEKSANIEKFGRLYSWYSAVGLPENSTNAPDTTTDPISHVKYIKGICPTGWALPTTASFESMLHAAGEDVKNIKSTNISTWLSGMTGTDITGFSAVGAGYYMDASPYFFDLLGEAFFWTSEGAPVEKKGTCCSITLTCPKLLYYTTDVHMGYSIRCVKRKND